MEAPSLLYLMAIGIATLSLVVYLLWPPTIRELEHLPRWEVVPFCEDGVVVGYKVRWSEPDEQKRYHWVGHYHAGDGTSIEWCYVAAESHCKRLNGE